MSVQAMSWVIENSKTRGNAYIVLLMVANRADEDGSSAWPSVRWLAKRSRLSERTVQRSLKKLEKAGALAIEKNAGPKGTNSYHVIMQASFVTPDKLTPRQGGRKGVTVVSPDTSLSTQNLKTPLPPASAGDSTEQFFTWRRETIGVQMRRRRRLPDLRWADGAQAERIVEFLNRNGLPARIVRAA